MGRDEGSQESKFTHPTIANSSPPSSRLLDYCGRGFCDPHPSPHLTARMQFKPCHGGSVSVFSPKPRHFASSFQPDHLTTTTHPHYPPSPFYTARLKPNRDGSVSDFCPARPPPTLSPRLALLMRRPHNGQLHHCTTPPFSTIFHYRFTRRA